MKRLTLTTAAVLFASSLWFNAAQAWIDCNDRGCRTVGDGGPSNPNVPSATTSEGNYIPITVTRYTKLPDTTPEDGYVNLKWTCPNFDRLGSQVLDRTFLGKAFGTYAAGYIIKITLTGAGNSYDTVLASFVYSDSAASKATATSYCNSIIQKMNIKTSLQMTVSVMQTSQSGIDTTGLLSAVVAVAKVAGVILSGPAAPLWSWTINLNDASNTLAGSKDTINSFLQKFGDSIASNSAITITPETQSVEFTIGGSKFVLAKQDYARSAVFRTTPSRQSDFEQNLLNATGVSAAKIRTTINSKWDDFIIIPANFLSMCSSYRTQLKTLGLTVPDLALLMYQELNSNTYPSGQNMGVCLLPNEIDALQGFDAFKKSPYPGGYGEVVQASLGQPGH